MPSRRRPQYTHESVEQQLQQIYLLDQSSSSENLEQLGPIIKQIHQSRQQDSYLRALQAVIHAKDAEIASICGNNYQDFLASISTLFTVKSYTNHLREKIASLDTSVSQVGRGLAGKKRSLLQAKKISANLDEAIDNLHASLHVLDVVNRIGETVQEGKYWSALRSIDDIQSLPPSLLTQTPLYQYILSSLPSLRGQIKNAVTAQVIQWLLDIRNLTPNVGRLALNAMQARSNKWKARCERDPLLRLARVGSAAETVMYEKYDYNVLENDELRVDFTPLYQSIHIYTALHSLNDLRRWYQESRSAQSELILQTSVQLSSLTNVVEEITGFFIIESHVVETTGDFRSCRDLEELWDAIVQRLMTAVGAALEKETDAASFVRVKELLLDLAATVELFLYSTQSIHMFILHLFEKYATLLERQCSERVKDVIRQEDLQPLVTKDAGELEDILGSVWLRQSEREELFSVTPPVYLPWSNSFLLCCTDIRSFIDRFYQFIEGLSSHHLNLDDLLSKSLDTILKEHVAASFLHRLSRTTQPSQGAQMIINLEYFEGACAELERSLTALHATQHGGAVRITAAPAFAEAVVQARARIAAIIASKLDGFELSGYDWTAAQKKEVPSKYLTELVPWLSTVVDSLPLKDEYKEELYKQAISHIARRWMDSLTGESVSMMNENGVAQILIDAAFLENMFVAMGHEGLYDSFAEIRATTAIALSHKVAEYLVPAVRQATYRDVRPKKLQAMLEKLAKYGATLRDPAQRHRADKRRREAQQIGRMFPGESR